MFRKDNFYRAVLMLAFVILTPIAPEFLFALDVPFKAQVPPGEWTETQNCGQACALMVFCYYKGTTPTEQGVKDIDDWLYNKYGDPINNYNGSSTDTTKLEVLAREYGRFPNSYKGSGWGLSRLRQEIDAGHPVIVAIIAGYLSNRGYPWAGRHFAVAKDYTDTHIICNDPGTSQGHSKYYNNSEFLAAVRAQGGAVVVIMQLTEHPWPMFGHDGQHTFRSPYTGPATSTIKWTFSPTSGSIGSGPAVDQNGTIYIYAGQGLLAIEEENGQPQTKWLFHAPESTLIGNPLIGPDGTVYVINANKILTVSPAGKLRWTAATTHWIDQTYPANEHRLNLKNGILYLSASYRINGEKRPLLLAFKADDGSLSWAFDFGAEERYNNLAEMTPVDSINASPSFSAIGKYRNIYVGFGPAIFALDAETGEFQWKKSFEIDPAKDWQDEPRWEALDSISIGDDGTIYFIVKDRPYVLGLDIRYSNFVYALSPQTINTVTTTVTSIETKWKPVEKKFAHGPILISKEGALYFAAREGLGSKTFLYQISPEGNLSKLDFSSWRSIFPQIIDQENKIYTQVSGYDYEVAVANSQGEQIWRDHSSNFSFTFALSKDGILYAPSYNYLYAFGAVPENLPPDQPTNISPANGATGVTFTPTLQSSPFSDPDAGDTHSASQWQITIVPGNYSSPVFDSGVDTQNLTQITVPSGVLAEAITYYWRGRHQDNHNAWSEWSVEISFTTFSSVGCAIIVAGEGDNPVQKWVFNKKADCAYEVLRGLGFSDSQISYLSANKKVGNGVDEYADIMNLYNAVTLRAARLVGPSSPLVLYMVDHGDEDTEHEFVLNEYENVSGSDLNRYFRAIPKETRVLIFIDSCYSGSFITDPTHSISSKDRTIVTACRADQRTRPFFDSFSRRFWIYLYLQEGCDVRQAFVKASEGHDESRVPLLDDNGDHEGHSADSLGDDGEVAAAMRIGQSGGPIIDIQRLIWTNLCSPGELRVYKSKGCVTGLVDGRIRQEIPDSVYIDESKTVVIWPAIGDYCYEVAGTDTGTYGLRVTCDGKAVNVFSAVDIPTLTGAIHQYSIDWDTLSQGEDGVTVQLDFDGDGIFEQSITSDNELTQSEYLLATIDNLIAIVEEMHLQRGIENSLVSKLEGAKEAIEREQQHAAVNKLDAFINEVEAQRGKKLSEGQTDELVAYGNLIILILRPATAPALVEPIPEESKLAQNYPNPFNPDTWIPYQLINDVDVIIRIYDVPGKLIKTLDLGHKPAGFYITKDRAAYWDGRNEESEEVSSGIYFIVMGAGEFTATRKMLMLR